MFGNLHLLIHYQFSRCQWEISWKSNRQTNNNKNLKEVSRLFLDSDNCLWIVYLFEFLSIALPLVEKNACKSSIITKMFLIHSALDDWARWNSGVDVKDGKEPGGSAVERIKKILHQLCCSTQSMHRFSLHIFQHWRYVRCWTTESKQCSSPGDCSLYQKHMKGLYKLRSLVSFWFSWSGMGASMHKFPNDKELGIAL